MLDHWMLIDGRLVPMTEPDYMFAAMKTFDKHIPTFNYFMGNIAWW